MTKIKIVDKTLGPGLMRLLEEPWQQLSLLENGSFYESANEIEFRTTEGLKISADKSSINLEDDKIVSYRGCINEIGGPQMLIDKLKSKDGWYVLRSFYPGSFFVVLNTDSNDKTPSKLPFKIDGMKFLSDKHICYRNGQVVISSSTDAKGCHKGANRGIQLEQTIHGGESYTVTVFNMESTPAWEENVQMAPKLMKIDQIASDKIVLRGFGHDPAGGSFTDYGLTIFHDGNVPTKLKLHLFYKKEDIEYFKSNFAGKNEPEIESLAKQAIAEYQNENPSKAGNYLVQIYKSVKMDPAKLYEVSDFGILGKSFLLMLDQRLSDDKGALQTMASIGYLCLTKALDEDMENLNLYTDRLLLLRMGHDPLKSSVMSALHLNVEGLRSFSKDSSDLQARGAIYKMEIADLILHPELYQQIELFNKRKNELDEMINEEPFIHEQSTDKIIMTGVENHKKLFNYLEYRVMEERDVDF